MPGAVAATLTSIVFDNTPATLTTTVAGPERVPNGTMTLSCLGDTLKIGADTPLILTTMPPSVVPNGNVGAAIVAVPKPVPNNVRIPSGETGDPGGAKVAPFNAPCGSRNKAGP